MDELAKALVEGGGFGVSVLIAWLLINRFIKKDVLGAIEEAQKTAKLGYKTATELKESLNGTMFKVSSSQTELVQLLNTEILKSSNNSAQAKADADVALQKVNVLLKGTENIGVTVEKLVKIATVVHEKNKHLETEVTKIRDELIFIKNKEKK
jgi:hypothetical protein